VSPPPAEASAVIPREPDWASGRAPSLPEAFRSVAIPGGVQLWRKLGAFAGPGFLIAVGYIDPGNWATDIASGSKYGYALLPTIAISNLLAVFLQALALKLGIATGRDLAQLSRERFGRTTGLCLWAAAELGIVACDLAEVIGSAIALQLLFGIPLTLGVCLTAGDVLLVLWFGHRGFRRIEAIVLALLVLIGGCFAIEIVLSHPEIAAVAGALIPSPRIVADPGMLYLAIGILGATVMPHNLYLHSSIAQTRRYDLGERGKREAIRFAGLDSITALTAALLINAAILIVAAEFHRAGHTDVSEIQDAYRLLGPLFGTGLASLVFGVALLAAGQVSTLTGTLAGQIVMQGFLQLRVSPVARRLITRLIAIVPAVVVASVSGASGTAQLLILSQIVLSLQLSFAVVPLVMFTNDRILMGVFVNRRWTKAAGWLAAALIALLNGWLVWLMAA
jgi:manganese transport protein